jgi:ATP-dependent RNA helicase RhlE
LKKFFERLIKKTTETESNPINPASPSKAFDELGLSDALCKVLKEIGYHTPTPIQQAAIPFVLKGQDLLGCAQTGTGKTAAFALPILQRLASAPPERGIKALVLAPTRELAIQIGENFEAYAKPFKLRTKVVFGGVGIEPQKQALRAGVDVLVATPGRLLDLHNQGFVDFRSLKTFVLDEADRMLDMGFIPDIRRIVKLIPQQRQTLLFSATMPKDIEELAMQILKNPAKVEVTPVSSTSELIDQSLYYVDRTNKRHLLVHLLEHEGIERALVFTRTKSIANKLAEFLSKAGFTAEAIHGNKSQSARQRALENFRSGRTPVLVASDIASRGIDIDEISHVINYDVPNIAETYVHRIGRTGRALATGKAFSLCDAEERAFIRSIEKLTGIKIPVVESHPFPATESESSQPRQQGGQGRSQRSPQRNGRNNPQRNSSQRGSGQTVRGSDGNGSQSPRPNRNRRRSRKPRSGPATGSGN